MNSHSYEQAAAAKDHPGIAGREVGWQPGGFAAGIEQTWFQSRAGDAFARYPRSRFGEDGSGVHAAGGGCVGAGVAAGFEAGARVCAGTRRPY